MTLIAAAAAAALPAASAAGPVDEECRARDGSPRLCVGLEKVGERASAECRRHEAAKDEQCVMPAGRRVIRSEVEAYRNTLVHQAHRIQYDLAGDVGFANAPWVGTHNSYNSTSEQPTVSNTDSNQQLSIEDQLRLDVRSIEIDIHWLPKPREEGFDLVVCHGLDESQANGGCTTERLFRETLADFGRWLAENPDEVVLLYIEDDISSAAAYAAAAADLDATIGQRIFRPGGEGCNKGVPHHLSRDAVHAAGKQVVIVSGCGSSSAWQKSVYAWKEGATAQRETGASTGYTEDCSPGQFKRADYDAGLIRYYEDSTWVSAASGGGPTRDRGITSVVAGRMARCGVDLVGLDQLRPFDGRLHALVWSFDVDAGQPAGPEKGSCAVQRPNGRWWVASCAGAARPAACRAADGTWRVTPHAVAYAGAAAACRAHGARLAVPRTGWENRLLDDVSDGEAWLGLTRSGTSWAPADAR